MEKRKEELVSLCPFVQTVLKKCFCCKKVKAGSEVDGRWVCTDCNKLK